jgi:hypothetical protein
MATGGCWGGDGGSTEAATRADGEVLGADGELVVALVAQPGTRRGLVPVECSRQLEADGAGSSWRPARPEGDTGERGNRGSSR